MRVFKGVTAGDWILTTLMTALGVALMLMNVTAADAHLAQQVADGELYRVMDSHSPWLFTWLAAPLALLWWRRSPLAVTGFALGVVALHDLVFGWVGRCGSGLPLALALSLLGALAYERRRAWLNFGLVCLLIVAVLVRDSITGLSPVFLAVPLALVLFGIGRAIGHRASMAAELRVRNEELRTLRDQRAAMEVAGDRAELASRLDGLLQDRLTQLSRQAESGADLDPAARRTLLEAIEADSRRTLQDMREIVGLLRGGGVALQPTPAVAHLDALLARHGRTDSRLRIVGDQRSLPASVELSAFRIVEHLVTALADQPDSPVEVELRFDDDALEIRVVGPVGRGSDLRAAVTRAKERAQLLGGSVDARVSRGRASAVAQLPVLG